MPAMTDPSNDELERRFAEHRIPLRKLYPWWYRLCRRAGIELKPPVLFTLADHFKFEGTYIAIVSLIGTLIVERPVPGLIPVYALILLGPLYSGWYYHRVRRRIGI